MTHRLPPAPPGASLRTLVVLRDHVILGIEFRPHMDPESEGVRISKKEIQQEVAAMTSDCSKRKGLPSAATAKSFPPLIRRPLSLNLINTNIPLITSILSEPTSHFLMWPETSKTPKKYIKIFKVVVKSSLFSTCTPMHRE